MDVSDSTQVRLIVPDALGWSILVGGALAIFATYWDEAFHTDVGRDSAWAAPHVLLYGSVGVVGAGVAFWGLRVLLATRSLRDTLLHLPLLAAGLGGLTALVAAPIDAGWHEVYGRDAVLWSAPHMLVVFAATALTLGVLVGVPPHKAALRVGAGALLLANAMAVVFEFEADVPQFSEVLYLPVLLTVGLLVAGVVHRTVPVRAPATTVVAVYVALRLAVMVGLAAMGRSTPDLPIAVIGLAAYDLPLRSRTVRCAAAALTTSALAWTASAADLASPVVSDVALAAVPLAALALAGLSWGRLRLVSAVVVVTVYTAGMLFAPSEPAAAHDPGQGEFVASVELTASSDGNGALAVRVQAGDHCDDLTARQIVVRRAGQRLSTPLTPTGSCSFAGAARVQGGGRWFVYAEFAHEGAPVEAWLPIDASALSTSTQARPLYVPAGSGGRASTAQIGWAALLYAVGVGVLGVGIIAVRRTGTDASAAL